MEYGIALGSNLGERLANLTVAAQQIGDALGADVEKSAVYQTAPIGCPPGSPPFFNSVILVDTTLPPQEILALGQRIESGLGRSPAGCREPNAPRPIDIDILYTGRLQLDRPGLQIPHPRLARRGFVLLPLSGLRPDLILPGQEQSIRELLEDLPDEEALLPVVAHHTEW